MSAANTILEAIEREGLLFVQDAKLPSVATSVAGEPVRGSWWGHPSSHAIFAVLEALDDEADVARFKLLDEKVCLVHRALWPAVAAIGRAGEPWQRAGLPKEAATLLARVEREGTVRASGAPVKALELRLLCVGEQVHTEAGKHVTQLSSWDRFAAARGLASEPTVTEAKATLVELAERWRSEHGRRPKLAWE